MPLADHDYSYISWMIFESQPSVVRGPKKSPAQMLFTHVVSDTPVPAVCQVLQLFQTKLGKANGWKPVPEQVCDSSTCVSPGIHFLSPAQIKSLISGRIRKDCQLLAGDWKNQTPTIPAYLRILLTWWWLAGIFRLLRLIVNSQPVDDSLFLIFHLHWFPYFHLNLCGLIW